MTPGVGVVVVEVLAANVVYIVVCTCFNVVEYRGVPESINDCLFAEHLVYLSSHSNFHRGHAYPIGKALRFTFS